MLSLKKKRTKYLRSIWGKQIDRFRNLDLIASYHNLIDTKGKETFIDEKTWNDLDFNSIFSKIDRNISGIGQQYLYHLMHKYESDKDILINRFNLITDLKNDQELREKIQLNLFSLSGIPSYFIAYLVLNKSISNTKYYPLFILSSILTVISLILIAVNGNFLFAALAFLLANLVINKIFSKKIYEYFTGFSSLNSLIVSAISISEIKSDRQIADIEYLKQKRKLLKSLKKKLGYLVINKEYLNELVVVLIEYLNMFLLFDIIAYYRSANRLLKNQKEMLAVFESVANLDLSISVASYLEETQLYSVPSFNSTGDISFEKLYHPLIKNAVPNTIKNLANSVLITGSNMSGKTTFIKTVGINFILSQTLYFSLSKKFDIPMYIVKSAIRREDDLEEGKSYFFVEIETLHNFIVLSEKNNKYLFLIDEIFKGTNTIERLAASTAVLGYLDLNNKVFVTTHDIELQDLLKDSYKMFHFSEQVENDEFFFNYKIKEGQCSSGNAIKLLKIMKYPDSITSEAESIASKLILLK